MVALSDFERLSRLKTHIDELIARFPVPDDLDLDEARKDTWSKPNEREGRRKRQRWRQKQVQRKQEKQRQRWQRPLTADEQSKTVCN